jgi:hypothetical protein
MRKIQPIQIWNAGGQKTASVLSAYIINDNLENSCTFYWSLREANVETEVEGQEEPQVTQGLVLADGNLTVTNEEYSDWDGSNETAYQWIADKLGITIVE